MADGEVVLAFGDAECFLGVLGSDVVVFLEQGDSEMQFGFLDLQSFLEVLNSLHYLPHTLSNTLRCV